MTESERKIVIAAIAHIAKNVEEDELTDYAINLICALYKALNQPVDREYRLMILAMHLEAGDIEDELGITPKLKPIFIPPPRGELGDALFNDRWNRDMTQKEYAATLNIREGLYGYWERGEGVPNITHLQAISEVLSVEVGELIRMVRDFVSPHNRKKFGEVL